MSQTPRPRQPRDQRDQDGKGSVLSIRPDLNVWCRKHAFSWRSPDGDQHLAVSDLAEICEQLVRLYEDNRQRGGKNRNRP